MTRLDLLDAVSKYGAAESRDMHIWEANIWTQARDNR